MSALCVRMQVTFKHLATSGDHRRTSMKYASRGSSGKFITIFPKSDAEFCELLPVLDQALKGFHGPYILTDVQFGNGPVFFRYGGFALDLMDSDDGATRFAIRTPDGRRIEDSRSPVFTLPNFVEPPALVRDAVRERLNPDPAELARILSPYVVRSSLHFSNSGGVYLAERTSDGTLVVLKEARRWAGYSSETTDATVRLRAERAALEALANVAAVVNGLGYRTHGDHEFLIEEHIEGVTLQAWVAANYPFSNDLDRITAYVAQALPLAEHLIAALDEVHTAGWAILDLQPKNVLIDGNNRVRLIDLEAARPLPDSAVGSIGTPGFIPHAWCSNLDRDRYALAAVVLHLFWPSLAGAFNPAVIRHRLNKVAELFPSEVTRLVEPLVTVLTDEVLATAHGYEHAPRSAGDPATLISQLSRGILRSKNGAPGAARRYPGDATQFTDGPGAMLNIETGTAGIALMLARAGEDVRPDIEWLTRQLSDTRELPFRGLLRGTAGIAAVLAQLGYADAAEMIVLGAEPGSAGRDLSLRTGLAGTVLALTEVLEHSRSEAVRRELEAHSRRFADAITDDAPLRSLEAETGNAVGLFDGWAGIGLTCRRLAELTNDPTWDHRMHLAFEREIAGLVSDDGNLRVDYSGVSYGYLSEGAAGIVFALARCAPERYTSEIRRLTASFDGIISLNGGLFRGTAGIASALLPLADPLLEAERARLIEFTLETFLFREGQSDDLMMLGDNGYHLSADYSTGTAGLIGTLLASHRHDAGLWFPVRLPSPTQAKSEGGEHDECIALTSGAAR